MMRDAMNIQERDIEEDYDVDRWIVVDDDEDMPPLESPEEQEEIDDRRRINPAEEDEEKEEDVRAENEEIPAFALPEFILRREEINVINELQDVFRRILSGYSILC